MRPVGTHRGNGSVRFQVQQVARRRLYASGAPEREGLVGLAHDRLAERWTLPFFQRLRERLLPRMRPVGALEVGELRRLASEPVSLWALQAEHALVLARDDGDTIEQLHERARRWAACLRTRTAPGLASPHWGHPVYGARLDPATGELDVVWATPGEWFEFALGALEESREPAAAHELQPA